MMDRWAGAAAATWNRHLSALCSFTAWAQRQEVLAANPARRLGRRTPARRGDRAIPRARLDELFGDNQHGLRERVLWRMLYETAARAEEILSLSVEDLDLEFRRARVTSKGGAIEYVHWATGTARLSPRLLRGRTSGPVFLADRRAPTAGSRAPAVADTCPATGRGRLSYPRRIPVQAGLPRPRSARAGLDTASTTPFRSAAPSRRRTNRPRTAGQIPPPAPREPRPIRRLGEETSARVTAEADADAGGQGKRRGSSVPSPLVPWSSGSEPDPRNSSRLRLCDRASRSVISLVSASPSRACSLGQTIGHRSKRGHLMGLTCPRVSSGRRTGWC